MVEHRHPLAPHRPTRDEAALVRGAAGGWHLAPPPAAGVRLSALLLLLALVLAAAPTTAQTDERLPGTRNPLLATALAVYAPGAGHFYAGERKEALVLATVVTAGFALFLSGTPGTDDCHLPTCDPGWAQHRVEIGTGIMFGAYVFSLVDAPLAARRRNRARRTLPAAGPTANLVVGGGGGPGIEIRLPVGR